MPSAPSALPGHVPATYARLLDEYLQAQPVAAWEPVGADIDALPMARWKQRLEQAADALGDPLLGLKLGQSIRPAHFGVLGYLFHACGTLGGALSRLERYQRLVYDMNPMRVQAEQRRIALIWSTEFGRPGPLVDACAITALITLAKAMTGRRDGPTEVHFVNPAPPEAHKAAYTDALCARVLFDADDTRVIFAADWMQQTLVHPDPALAALLEQQADALLEQLPEKEGLARELTRVLARALPQGPPDQERIAAALGLSVRTLHRRLESSGFQYRQLLAQTRRELAERHLADPRIQLSEVAQLCGYSEQSAFSRAYKQWTGRSPLASRQRLTQGVRRGL